jgi:hypothetical protein
MNSREGKSMTYRSGGEGGILTHAAESPKAATAAIKEAGIRPKY